MTSPDEKQLQETPDAAAGTMVRACDRCGTVCSTDQEWCLSCGVRMTEPSQRLPGLRAAGLVVALATLLAGGAAAASYAALRGDERSAANVPAESTPAPVAQAPAATPPAAATPTTTTPDTTASVPDSTPAPSTSDLDTSGDADTSGGPSGSSAPTSPITPSGSGSSGSGSGGSGSTGSGSTGSGSTSTPSTPSKPTKPSKPSTPSKGSDDDDAKTPSVPTTGPVQFAAGQGSIYDPDGVVADRGDEANAIDGSTGTSWKVELAPEQTGGFGYVVDFSPATKLTSLNVVSGTAGATVKILGTTSAALPEDALDNGWDTIAGETTLKKGDNTIALKAVSGASGKYRHVLVFVTETPGTPAALAIREIKATR